MIWSKEALSDFTKEELEEEIIVQYKIMRNTFFPREKREEAATNRQRCYVALKGKI